MDKVNTEYSVEPQLLRMLLETAVESKYMYIGRDVIIEAGISEEELSEIEKKINGNVEGEHDE